jgi:hypothetical protein
VSAHLLRPAAVLVLLGTFTLAACSGGGGDAIEERLRGHDVFQDLPSGATEMGFSCAPAGDVGFCLMVYATEMSPDQIGGYYASALPSGTWRRLPATPGGADVIAQLEWTSNDYDVYLKVRDTSAWNGDALPAGTRYLVSLTLAER